uniref:Uncharacterized protein n=1 Tax=Solanum lycopersicum TaxID=4081 RepID=A0A3Q7HS52_SOLLC
MYTNLLHNEMITFSPFIFSLFRVFSNSYRRMDLQFYRSNRCLLSRRAEKNAVYVLQFQTEGKDYVNFSSTVGIGAKDEEVMESSRDGVLVLSRYVVWRE